MNRVAILILLALTGLWPRTALAADAAGCTLKLINTVPITMAANNGRPLVNVSVNGTELKFLLDTGGSLTQISAATAKELKLPRIESNVKLLDLYGGAASDSVMVTAFTLGRLTDKNTTLAVSPFDFDNLVTGILAADYMGEYDIELDFASGKMNYFSRDHCKGKVVYWPAAAIAVAPMKLRDYHVNLDVTLDGHPFKAMIDTGASNTTLTIAEAKRVFGITADTPGDKQIYEDRGEKAFEHVFQKLSFEGLEVGNPHIAIIPDKTGSRDPNNDFVTGSRVHRVDDRDATDPVMLIGMNILSKLRLYIAFSENKIYITPASAPQISKPAR